MHGPQLEPSLAGPQVTAHCAFEDPAEGGGTHEHNAHVFRKSFQRYKPESACFWPYRSKSCAIWRLKSGSEKSVGQWCPRQKANVPMGPRDPGRSRQD
jgi:hypothetical protein